MRRLLGIIAASVSSAACAYAHGPQIQITPDGSKIVTREIILDGPYSNSLTPPKSVYVMPFKDNLGVTYARPNNVDFVVPGVPEFYSGPGIAYGYLYPSVPEPFPVGGKFNLQFITGLTKWNGTIFDDAGAAELQAFTGGFAAPTGTIKTVDLTPSARLPIPAGAATIQFTDGAETHSTVRYRYLGDGVNPSSAPDGLYLAVLQLTLEAGPIFRDSNFVLFVLNKNVAPGVAQAAVGSLGLDPSLIQTLVPEPASATMAVLGLVGVRAQAARRRPRRGATRRS